MDSPGGELERLHADVTSLCGRIERLPCFKAKDRLAQSGQCVCKIDPPPQGDMLSFLGDGLITFSKWNVFYDDSFCSASRPEMAKCLANILRVVLSLQQGGEGTPDPRHIPLCHLAPHIGRLPMPEDYALEELRSLTQSYLREYVVSH